LTEELRALILALTCPHCNGEGKLAWRADTITLGVLSRHSNTIMCDECAGDGCNPAQQRAIDYVEWRT
jgi:DnaJ-class molecular chaperone